MTYIETTAFLRRYQDSLRLQRELELERERLRSEATRISPILSDMPRGASGSDKLAEAVSKIIEADEKLACQINFGKAVRNDIVNLINSVSDERQHEILRRKYLLGQRFEQIAFEMNLDYRWVRRLHSKSIEKLTLESPLKK